MLYKNNQLGIKNLIFMFFVLFVLTYLIMVLLFFNNEYLPIGLKTHNWLVVISFISLFLYWNIGYSKSMVDGVNLILLTFFIFLGSESVVRLLDLNTKGYFVSVSLSETDHLKASLCIILGSFWLILGAILGKRKRPTIKLTNIMNKLPENINGVALSLLIIGGVFFILGFDSSLFNKSYKEFGEQGAISLIWRISLPLAGFSLILSQKKKYQRIGSLVLIFLTLYFFMIGNRGYAISLLLSFIWLYNFRIKKLNFFKVFIICIMIIFSINIFYQLKSMTVKEKLDLSTYTSMESLPLTFLFEEGSTTYRSIAYSIKYIPEEKNYSYGSSYLWGMTTIIPNIFGGDVHPAAKQINPSEWLGLTFNPEQIKKGNGFGFSIIAEAYYNFGLIGIALIMFMLGYYISCLENLIRKSNNLFFILLLAISLQNLIWGIRNIFQSVVRFIAWEVVLLFVIYAIVIVIKGITVKRVTMEGQKKY